VNIYGMNFYSILILKTKRKKSKTTGTIPYSLGEKKNTYLCTFNMYLRICNAEAKQPHCSPIFNFSA
jgi:hypothetical protein